MKRFPRLPKPSVRFCNRWPNPFKFCKSTTIRVGPLKNVYVISWADSENRFRKAGLVEEVDSLMISTIDTTQHPIQQDPTYKNALLEKLANNTAKIAVIGMGYVGIPLAVCVGKVGLQVLGID